MKHCFLLFIFSLIFNSSFAQEKENFTKNLSVQAYSDLTKSNTQTAAWITFDYKKITVEARYNYDWDNNVSLYAGPFLKYKAWNFQLLQGLTFGNTTGLSFSPTAVLDKKKIYLFNQAQYVIGLSKMPSYFSHWGEIYFKPSENVWIGITDRVYFGKTFRDIAFGPQVSFLFKDFFLTFYWWIPSKQTESKAFIQMGYEHDFNSK